MSCSFQIASHMTSSHDVAKFTGYLIARFICKTTPLAAVLLVAFNKALWVIHTGPFVKEGTPKRI